jgi:hypothetical protein
MPTRDVEKAIVACPTAGWSGLLEACELDRVVVRPPYRTEVTTSATPCTAAPSQGSRTPPPRRVLGEVPSPGARGTTIGFSLSFLSAGRGVDLVAEARVRRRGKEICNGEVVVTDAKGAEVAQAIVTYKLSDGASR